MNIGDFACFFYVLMFVVWFVLLPGIWRDFK